MGFFRIAKVFEVEYGHRLSKHPEKCRFLHGHRLRIEIVVRGHQLDGNDMVCDYKALKMVVAELGFAVDPEPVSLHEVAVATQPIESPIGVIEPGLVAAQRFTWQRIVAGEPVVTVRVNWFMGEAGFDTGWSFGPEGERFEIEVTGDPSSRVVFHGWHPESVAAGLVRNPGIVATANHCVSAIPYVCRAGPGIKTYLDLPLVAGRAAPHLGAGQPPP